MLTSGAAGNCLAGMENIARLQQLRDDHQGPEVLIGAGVNARVIAAFRSALPQTNEANIRTARSALDA